MTRDEPTRVDDAPESDPGFAAKSQTRDRSADAECVPYCPHYQVIQGSCGHASSLDLVRYFERHPGATCPIYEEVRTEVMRGLEAELDPE